MLNERERGRAEALPAVVVLVALSAIAPLSIDMFLPSLPTMTEEFGATRSTMQLAVLLFILAFAGSQLVYGPTSDRVGRRPVLFVGLTLFVAGGLVALFARTPEMLIAGRVLQGVGGGAGPALAQAMVLDVYGRERAARVLAYMAVALPLAPAIAPIIGGFLHEAWGWQSVFVTLCALGVALAVGYRVLLPETNPAARRQARARTSVLADYRSALSSRTFVAYALVMGLMFSGQLVFISTSAFVLIEELALDERVYGFSFALVAGGLMVGAWTSSRLVTRLTSRQRVILGAGISACASGVLAAAAWLVPPSLVGLLAPMVFVAVGLGITRPAAVAGALIEFPLMAGLASAVLGFTQMLVASLLNIVYGALVEPSTRALASGVCFAMFAGLATILALRPGRRAATDLEVTRQEAVPSPVVAAAAPSMPPAAVPVTPYLGRPRGPVFSSPSGRPAAVRPTVASAPMALAAARTATSEGRLGVVLGAAALAIVGAVFAATVLLGQRSRPASRGTTPAEGGRGRLVMRFTNELRGAGGRRRWWAIAPRSVADR